MAADGTRFQNAVLDLLQGAESALLGTLHALGLAPVEHGQPAWPFVERIATETLLIDAALTRRLAIVIVGVLLALVLTLVAVAWRKARGPLVAGAVALLAVLPWPPATLILTHAFPTSFHRSPTGFQAASIARGLATFASRCASCHGDDGGGEGPRAAALPMWPPRLGSALLWRRAEGEVFWHIVHGMHDRHGVETMPGITEPVDDAEVWALIDAIKAIAAGTSVREDAAWSEPVRVPDAWVRCDEARPARRLSSLRGQRLRLVAADGPSAPPRDDPRLVTILLRPTGAALPGTCVIDEPDAYAVFARVTGHTSSDFGGAQLIVDRDGWLRAYGRPGESGWSQGDLICRSRSEPVVASSRVDGLGALIAAIDADPVRSAAGGLAHGR